MAHFQSKATNYRSLSLLDLGELIKEQGNSAAMKEFLNRTCFHSTERPRLRCTEYLDSLRNWASRNRSRSSKSFETADKAYDMTLDKFTNIPPAASLGRTNMKPSGPDCRLYWGAFLDHVKKEFKKDPPAGQLDAEKRTAVFLQRFVRRHYFLSLLEAERNANEFWSRYNWRVGNRSIIVWLPRFLRGAERRQWLEKNIRDPDPDSPRERERIQAVIGKKWGTMAFVQMQDNIGTDPTDDIIDGISGSWRFRETLSRTVAEEKSAGIENQRRSIRQLGKKKLKQLILRIFEDLESDAFQNQQVAQDFGLSKATFSRFAGSKWQSSGTDTIPDLWLNTAQVLASNKNFKEAAIQAGIYKDVEKILKKIEGK
jgi:hypothetical protein